MSSITREVSRLLHCSVDFPAEIVRTRVHPKKARGAARQSVSYLTEAAGLHASFILVENRRHHC